jgi:hypothetical protein
MSQKKERGRSRRFFISLEGIDLNSLEGQNQIITLCQRALLTEELTEADRRAIKLLIDIIKVKKDIDALKMAEELRARMKKLEETIQRLQAGH